MILQLNGKLIREFTLAVQTEVEGNSEAGVGRAGKKMQQVLDIAMAQLLADASSKSPVAQ